MAHILGAHILLHDPRLGTHKEDLEWDRRVEEAFRWPSNELLGCMGSDQCEMQPTSFPLVREKKIYGVGNTEIRERKHILYQYPASKHRSSL